MKKKPSIVFSLHLQLSVERNNYLVCGSSMYYEIILKVSEIRKMFFHLPLAASHLLLNLLVVQNKRPN